MCLPLRVTLLSGLLAAAVAAAAQPVQDARDAVLGTSVTFNGVVTSGASLGEVRYVQDGAAGIAVFPGAGSPTFTPEVGDAITVTGTLTNYNGLLEVTPIAAFSVTSQGDPLPAPELITPAGVGEAREGRLVRLNGMHFIENGTFTSGSHTLSNGSTTAEVYLRAGHPLVGTAIPLGDLDVIGIVSQYDPSSPYTSGYQLLPRDAGDLVIGGPITIVGPVVQSALTPSGFTLSWSTNMAGTSQVAYGLTPALGSFGGTLAPVGAHAAVLTGLEPATFYYARVFSVNGSDTAFSDIGFYSTASTSSGTIRAYFNHTVDLSVSSGVPAHDLGDAMDDTIKAYIDRAQLTLDVAMYNTSSTFLVNAVNDAVARGVRVRWIAEGSNDNFALDDLVGEVPVLYRTDGLGSGTHDKFIIVDAEDPQNAWVMSGSPNWTNQSLYNDQNNLVFLQDQALARCYRLEFEEMWGGSEAQFDAANSRFGAEKADDTPHLFSVGGREVRCYFSPTDGTTARIAEELGRAQQRVEFALYVYTENTLASAMAAADDRPGVTVRGDIEDVNVLGSEFAYLQGQGVEVFSHDGEPYLLHHKYAIVDEGGADPRVITGSHNWTATAETTNDENTLIIHDATVANLFYQEWSARHSAVAAISERSSADLFRIVPNPVRASLVLTASLPATAEITIVDAFGRVVHAQRPAPSRTVDVSALGAGTYLLVVRDADGTWRGAARFVKE